MSLPAECDPRLVSKRPDSMCVVVCVMCVPPRQACHALAGLPVRGSVPAEVKEVRMSG